MIGISELLTGLLLLVIGSVLTLVIQKMRSSLSLIQWQATVLAVANRDWTDPAAGDLRVELGGVEIGNLWQSTVIVSNESGRDLADIEFVFRFQDGQHIIHHAAMVSGQAYYLENSAKYIAILDQARGLAEQEQRTDQEQIFIDRTNEARGLAVPTLNRNQSIEAQFVVTTRGEAPIVGVTSSSTGIKCEPKPYIPVIPNERWGISLVTAVKVGIPINIAVVAALYYTYGPSWIMLAVAIILTSLQSIFGIVALRFLRFLKSFFS